MIRRERKPRLVIAFHTTADALHLEQAAKVAGFPGRLIPVPREITAGCGLAWRDEPENEKSLRDLLAQTGIEAQGLRILTL